MKTRNVGDADGPTDGIVPTRQCGRCRRLVDAEPGTHAWELRDWWLCPQCATALTPHGPTGPD